MKKWEFVALLLVVAAIAVYFVGCAQQPPRGSLAAIHEAQAEGARQNFRACLREYRAAHARNRHGAMAYFVNPEFHPCVSCRKGKVAGCDELVSLGIPLELHR